MLRVAKNTIIITKRTVKKNLTLGWIISIFGFINFDYWCGCEE